VYVKANTKDCSEARSMAYQSVVKLKKDRRKELDHTLEIY